MLVNFLGGDMETRFLKVVLLAAVSDGQIQEEELALISQIKKTHPALRKISDETAQLALADVYNKLSAGMEARHILEQLGEQFSVTEKHSAYALAKEVCAADFTIDDTENEFLQLIEDLWDIPADVVDAVAKSSKLRYDL
jgi:uncharacterized membrane protein YebE (DUF533 family)